MESQLEKGATFRVEFPVEILTSETQLATKAGISNELPAEFEEVAEKTDQPILDAARSPTPNPAKPTILVVEDNLELQDYIRLILQEKYNVITKENGQVALQWLMGDPGPDCQLPSRAIGTRPANCQLILSDLMMPVMDGYQLLEKLKSGDATRHIPVIMLTARAEA